MYAPKDKVILTDVDGVLLDWDYAFNVWMTRHGYTIVNPDSWYADERYELMPREAGRLVMMFNESAWMRRLPALRDSIKYVKKLHEEHGYVFHAITSMTDDEYAQHLRTKNLRELFGETVFERYVYLGCGAPKDGALQDYRNSECYWVEDKSENAALGVRMGLDGILMHHPYNSSYEGDVKRVHTWKEIYNHIVGE